VDAQKTMARDYRTLGPMGWISRTVYIIDKNGVIRYARRGMPSTQELLGIIEKLDTP
jgi:peroxiredoxin